MEVIFLRSFIQDFKQIHEQSMRRKVERTVKEIQAASSLRGMRNLKKLEGHANAFRIRVGDYRIGFFLSNGVIELAHVANRRDIYRTFP